jgi:hypothetical protein
MMGGPGRFGDILNQETLKPRSLGNTLRRLALPGFWPRRAAAGRDFTDAVLPDLMGRATDCSVSLVRTA